MLPLDYLNCSMQVSVSLAYQAKVQHLIEPCSFGHTRLASDFLSLL